MDDMNPTIDYLRRQRETWTEVVTATTGMKIVRISEDGLATGYYADDPENPEDEDDKYGATVLWIFNTVLMNSQFMTVNASAGPLWEKLASLASKQYSPKDARNTSHEVLDSMPRGTFLHGREVVRSEPMNVGSGKGGNRWESLPVRSHTTVLNAAKPKNFTSLGAQKLATSWSIKADTISRNPAVSLLRRECVKISRLTVNQRPGLGSLVPIRYGSWTWKTLWCSIVSDCKVLVSARPLCF